MKKALDATQPQVRTVCPSKNALKNNGFQTNKITTALYMKKTEDIYCLGKARFQQQKVDFFTKAPPPT